MHLAALHIHPVKSLRAVDVPQAVVEPWGLAGDRRWMVVDAAGRFLTQREHPSMARILAEPAAGGIVLQAGDRRLAVAFPGGDAATIQVTVWRDSVAARVASGAAHALLGAALGLPCRLVWLHDPGGRAADPHVAPAGSTVSFADGFPLLLASEASLADLNARLASRVPMARFRPNLAIAGGAAWDEDAWTRVRIGAATFAVVKACERCVVTTVDPTTGERPDPTEPLRTLAQFRRDRRGGVVFGQNLVPEAGGTIRVGDAVEVLARGRPNVELMPERRASPASASLPAGE